MIIHFDITATKETSNGTFLIGKFTEKPPYSASNQKFKLGEFEFEIWGVPKAEMWTLILVSEKTFNEVLEEQIVQLEVL
ncbi:MAG: hypothetical protein HC817_15275 [Saprospiraceae bacterium]|nr:hypothetical protein [Saprospiraceae bacterium]